MTEDHTRRGRLKLLDADAPPRVQPTTADDVTRDLISGEGAAVSAFGSPGQAVYQLHHLATPLLHCRGVRCVTRLPHAMLTDRSNIATDLQRLRSRLRGRAV